MNMIIDLMSTASNHYGDEFTKIIKAISSIISESYITRLTVTVTDVNRSETYRSVVAKPYKDGCFCFKDGVNFPLHIWCSTFLNATFNIEDDIFSDGKEVNVIAYVRSSGEVDVKDINSVSINTVAKPKVIDTTKPIPTDDVRQLIDAVMDRDDKEIYIYKSKDATTITIRPTGEDDKVYLDVDSVSEQLLDIARHDLINVKDQFAEILANVVRRTQVNPDLEIVRGDMVKNVKKGDVNNADIQN